MIYRESSTLDPLKHEPCSIPLPITTVLRSTPFRVDLDGWARYARPASHRPQRAHVFGLCLSSLRRIYVSLWQLCEEDSEKV